MAIKELLEKKTPKEKGTIKGVEIAKALKKKKYTFNKTTKKWK